MKFKIDENLPVEFAENLIAAGHDATTVVAEHHRGAVDSAIVNLCLQEGYILVTLDLDFADIYAYPPAEFPGFVVFRLSHQDKGHLLEVLQRILPLIGRETIEGRLWVVEESRVRIRGED